MLRPAWSRTVHPARLLLMVTAALLTAFLLPRTAGAEPGIEILQAGWDGAIVQGTWTPVRLKVTGTDRDVRALVEVIPQMEFRTSPLGSATRYPLGSYGQMVSLPAAVTREVTIWYPADQEPATVRLSVDNRVLAEQTLSVKMARPGWPLIAVTADSPGVVRSLRSIELSYQGLPLPLAVSPLEMATIPEDADRLRGISALVVQGNAASQATASQRNAVLSWLRGGGHLLLVGGANAADVARILPEGALPLTFAGSAPVTSTEPLRTWLGRPPNLPPSAPAARFQYSGGELLAGTPAAPLVWRMQVGGGTATILAFDPTLEPLASWEGLPGLLRQTLDVALPNGAEQPGARPPGGFPDPSLRLQDATMLLPSDAHPDWALIGVLLAGFALVVGPGVYVLLRRVQRRGLVWIAVPVAALVFASAIYTWGVESRGRDLIVNAAAYLELGATPEEPARQSVAAAFYGPTYERLSVEVPAEGSVRALGQGQMGPYPLAQQDDGSPSDPPFRVIDGTGRRVDFLSGQYSQRAVMFEREIENAPRGTADITLQQGLLAGTLRNDSAYRLENAAVVIGTSVAKLGTLAPGQSVPVRLEPEANSAAMMFKGQPISQYLFGEQVTDTSGRGGPPPGYYQVPNDAETQRRAQMLDNMLISEMQNYVPGPPSLPLTFVAYTRDLPVVRDLLPEEHPTYELTLLRQPLVLRLDPGPFVMPSGLLPGRLTESSTAFGLGGGGNGTLQWIELRSGSATYGFKPALNNSARIDTLVLRTEQIGATTPLSSGPGQPPGVPVPVPPNLPQPGGPPNFAQGPAEAGVFSVFDWQLSAWASLPAGSEHRLPGDRFAGPGGEVRVRVQSSEIVRFVVPALTLEGRVEAGAR